MKNYFPLQFFKAKLISTGVFFNFTLMKCKQKLLNNFFVISTK